MIVDDQEVYSTGLVSSMTPVFQKAGIKVDHESVSQKVTDFSSLVAKVTPETTVVVLPWQVAANGQQFGKNLAEQHKNATIVGTDGMYSPSAFTTPGSYVSTFGPDINSIPADASIAAAAKAAYPKYGTFGPPIYAATHVLDEAIAVGVQVRNADPQQRAVGGQGDRRVELDPRSADQVRPQGRLDRRQVVPVQDQLEGQVHAGHQLVIS